LLRRADKQFSESTLKIRDLIIDSKSQRVWRNDQEVTLTTKEFAVLEYFARNVDRVIGREELSEHCWDETFDAFSNSIEVFINRLRKKIDCDRKTPLLQTRRGAGYILQDLKIDENI
jgi:DNA-binding response OmpR family regulator